MRHKITLEQMTYGGSALGHLDGKAVFVEGGVAGEQVIVDVFSEKGDYILGKLSRVTEPSPYRIEPPCAHFDRCGGCQWQHIEYAAQLRFKEQILAEQMRRIGGFQEVNILPILGMRHPWGYRQKARFGLRTSKGRVRLGFYEHGTHEPVKLDACPVLDDRINGVLTVLQKTSESSLRPFQGFCTVEVRSSQDEIQFLFNTSTMFRQPLDDLVNAVKELPHVKGIHQRRLRREAPLQYQTLSGDPYLSYEMGGLTLSLQPTSFFQVNVVQARRLFERSIGLLEIDGGRTLDAHCGVGALTLMAAQRSNEAVGIETVATSVDDARQNARFNSITNARFVEGLFQDQIHAVSNEAWDSVILDPPREGIADKTALQELATVAQPQRILYISCNPSTLARDCRRLSSEGYRPTVIQPVDMFPHTYHIETIALLERQVRR